MLVLNTGVKSGEGLEGGFPFKYPPLQCAEKLTHFYPQPTTHHGGMDEWTSDSIESVVG